MQYNPELPIYFKSIKVTNSLEDIFDIAVIERNNWQMYRSANLTTKPIR